MFENMRQNTQVSLYLGGPFPRSRINQLQGLVNTHLETEKNLKGSVLPILDRLHKEIKNKAKELASGASKGAKEVEKVRNTTQKHIELLGQTTAGFESSGGKMNPSEDPYIVHRGVYHRLGKQVMEENNNRHDLIAVQNNFAQFEAHIIEVIQQAFAAFHSFVGGQAQKQEQIYSDMLGTAQRVPPDFEWTGFVQRSSAILIDPNSPERTVEAISFPNQNHSSTKPLIEGTLERKSRNKLSLSGYSTGYYVVTPSKFLHEFKDNDNIRKDPQPELSIYLPDAIIGATSGEKFNVKGKDVSKGIGSKLSGTSEISFKAHTAADASKWHEAIKSAASSTPIRSTSDSSSPAIPAEFIPVDLDKKRSTQPPVYSVHPSQEQTPTLKTQGITGGETVASPISASSPHPAKSEGA